MQITDIENLSIAELKQRRDEMIAAASEAPIKELAERYVQARTDAKQRDEKLAEQARTLDSLNSGIEAANVQIADLKQRLKDSDDRNVANCKAALQDADQAAACLAKANQAHDDYANTAKQAIAELESALASERARAERLKSEAVRNHSALSQSARLINDAIAAQAIDIADQG